MHMLAGVARWPQALSGALMKGNKKSSSFAAPALADDEDASPMQARGTDDQRIVLAGAACSLTEHAQDSMSTDRGLDRDTSTMRKVVAVFALTVFLFLVTHERTHASAP
jgi:hypothetical protein